MSKDWIFSGSSIISVDSSFQFEGKNPLKISPISIFDYQLPIDVDANCVLLLPNREEGESIMVSIIIRTMNINNGTVFFRQMSEQEDLIQIDSFLLPVSHDSLSVEFQISNCDTRMLFVQVRVDGKSNYTKSSSQNIWISSPLLSGNSISSIEKPHSPILPELDSIDLEQIDQLKTTPIIAIGELIHGSESINQLAFDMIKFRIEFCNTKLVILEFNAESMLAVNRYIHGDTRFTKASIQNKFDRSLFSNHIIELIDWIKEYNRGCDIDNKVWIWGTEIGPYSILSKLYIHDFFQVFRDNFPKDTLLRRFCQLLLSTNDSASREIMQILEQTNHFQSVLSKEEISFLQLYFKVIDKIRSSGLNLLIRDNQMFEICDYFISDKINGFDNKSTVTVYTHFLHANYLYGAIPNSDYHSMGYWLKQKYGQGYKCFGMTSSEGVILSKMADEDRFVENEITVESESIENYLSSVGEQLFIDSKNSAMNKLNPTLQIGTFFLRNNTQVINLSKRVDGLFYHRTSRPIFKPKEVLEEIRVFNSWMFDWYKSELKDYIDFK